MSKWDKYFMKVAHDTAELSSCKRKQVGAVTARNKRIVLCGYNGTPEGADNCCEEVVGRDERTLTDILKTKDEVSHAEENLISYAAREGTSLKGTTMYLTLSPCINCAKMIKNAGITKVFYEEFYNNPEGIEYLERHGVEVEKYEN